MVICLCIAVFVIAALSIKIYLLKRSAREISEQIEEKLSGDTNTVIGISSADRDMRGLAATLNVQLKELRQQKLQFTQGDLELRNAVTNVSHDLRTPLTAISSYLELLEDDPERLPTYLPILRERTDSLVLLTEELFRYSVITSDGSQTETDTVLLNSVLEESIIAFYAPLRECGISPVIEITEKRIERQVNRQALSRVFSNLLNNAMKYSDGDLKIVLSEDGTITFSNTSAELSKVQVERLFDRFYTVESAHKSTGLGLSIARALVEQMNGTITSGYADGTLTITIRL